MDHTRTPPGPRLGDWHVANREWAYPFRDDRCGAARPLRQRETGSGNEEVRRGEMDRAKRLWTLACAPALLVWFALAPAEIAGAQDADRVYVNANVYTVDKAFSKASAICRQGRPVHLRGRPRRCSGPRRPAHRGDRSPGQDGHPRVARCAHAHQVRGARPLPARSRHQAGHRRVGVGGADAGGHQAVPGNRRGHAARARAAVARARRLDVGRLGPAGVPQGADRRRRAEQPGLHHPLYARQRRQQQGARAGRHHPRHAGPAGRPHQEGQERAIPRASSSRALRRS